MTIKRKTRFERINPEEVEPVAKKPRVRADPKAWLKKARRRHQHPFEVEVIDTVTKVHDAITGEDSEEVTTRREFNPFQVGNILKDNIESGLQLAYLSGIAEGITQMETIILLIQVYAPRNKRIQKEVSAFIADFKKRIAEGRKIL